MNESVSQDCAALLEHAGWVRALARHLTADAHAADDLAQDALAAALARPPSDSSMRGSLRAWLTGVVRNLARQERRSAESRGARERAVARDEADVSSAQLFERLESHRAVVEAVARLDEPYRAAILMRYFEGLAPAVIAARTGAPLRTVHTRLNRALARLRTELDRAHGGDRRAWLLALLPYAGRAGRGSTAALGALVMDAKLKLALAAVAVVGICSTVALWPADSHGNKPSTSAPLASEARPAEPPGSGPALAEASAPGERSAVEAPAVAPAPPAPSPARLAGRVIDVERAPVAGVEVRYSGDGHDGLTARTDADGIFELEPPTGGGRLDVVTPGWTCVFRPEFALAASGSEFVLVVARAITLGGTVLDERRQPVADAELAVPMPYGLRARFDAILDRSSTVEHSTKTGADGRFELAGLPLVPGVELVTTHAAYLADRRALPPYDELALELVLRSVHEGPGQLVGTVVDPAGAPVEGAWVALGQASTRSGPAGAFALALESSAEAATPLRAVKPGYLPAELARASGGAWPEPLILRLGDAPLAIAGTVVGADGEPVPFAEVWSDDETHFGYIPIEGGEMAMRVGANIEGILRGDPWTWRRTADARGRFELGGLLPRDYRVHAFDKRHLLASEARVAAGRRDVELRMPEDELHERIAGRVTDLAGAPLAELEVLLELAPAGRGPDQLFEGTPVTTDADGRFAFEAVSRAVDTVRVRGVELGLEGFRRALGPADDVENLALAVPLRVHVQIDGGEQPDFDQVALLDARGERLDLSIQHGKSAYSMRELRLNDGRTEAFSVSELAQTLVLYAQEVEVRRVPLKLVRGELNTLRP